MDENFIKRGERMGTILAFGLTLGVCWFFLALLYFSGFNRNGIWGRDYFILEAITEPAIVLTLSIGSIIFAAVPMAIFGFFIGRAAAKCSSIKIAFLQGATIIAACVIGFVLGISLLSIINIRLARGDYLCIFYLSLILTIVCSLISGLSAIYVRDFRQLQRKKPIPQFTMQEMIVVFTLFGVIISSITSIAIL